MVTHTGIRNYIARKMLERPEVLSVECDVTLYGPDVRVTLKDGSTLRIDIDHEWNDVNYEPEDDQA